jgi:hypothetical protein
VPGATGAAGATGATGAAGTTTWTGLTDVPTTIAYKNADNQFTVGQGVRGALAGNAAAVYIPWVSGDALPALVAGSSNASNNQIALSGISFSGRAIQGTSTNNAGVYGLANGSGTALAGEKSSAITAAMAYALLLRHNTSGTPAATFGVGIELQLQSSTTVNQDAADIRAIWTDPTHATRKARLAFSAFDTAAREGLRIDADGAAARVGLYGVTAVARQTAAAAATDLATAITLVNDLRTKLIALGALQ